MPTQTPYGPYFAQSGGDGQTEGGNILAQGLEAIIANQERNRGVKALATQFSRLGPDGENIARHMEQDPGAAFRAFELFGGAENLYKQIQTRQASKGLADAMTNVQASRGQGQSSAFDYQGFVKAGLGLGIPLGQLSAATQAIATGNEVNQPEIGQTEDWTEQNGQGMRRRIFYDKKSGGIISAGDWSPAFRPPSPRSSRMTRVNPETGEVEIFENMSPLQRGKEVKEGIKGEQGIENAATILSYLDSAESGVSGLSGTVGETVSGTAAGVANLINNMAGGEIVDPEGTEDEIASRIMGASPESRAHYMTAARQFTTSVRQNMDLGKPSNADLQIAQEAAAAMSNFKSPRGIATAVEDLAYLNTKYRWLYEYETGAPSRFQLNTKEGMKQFYETMVNTGMSPERAERLAIRTYKSLAELAPPQPE